MGSDWSEVSNSVLIKNCENIIDSEFVDLEQINDLEDNSSRKTPLESSHSSDQLVPETHPANELQSENVDADDITNVKNIEVAEDTAKKPKKKKYKKVLRKKSSKKIVDTNFVQNNENNYSNAENAVEEPINNKSLDIPLDRINEQKSSDESQNKELTLLPDDLSTKEDVKEKKISPAKKAMEKKK